MMVTLYSAFVTCTAKSLALTSRGIRTFFSHLLRSLLLLRLSCRSWWCCCFVEGVVFYARFHWFVLPRCLRRAAALSYPTVPDRHLHRLASRVCVCAVRTSCDRLKCQIDSGVKLAFLRRNKGTYISTLPKRCVDVFSCHFTFMSCCRVEPTKLVRAGGRSGACTERSTTTISRSCRFLSLKTRVPSTHTGRYGTVRYGVEPIWVDLPVHRGVLPGEIQDTG